MIQDRGISILLANASEHARAMLRIMLTASPPLPRTVHEASSKQETLSLYHALKPDILVYDLGISGADGLEILRTIRERYNDQDIFILVLTEDKTPDLQVTCLHSGANEFLLKPFSQPELLSRIAVAERQVALTRRLTDYTNRIHKEIELVASLQEKLLPAVSPNINGVSVEHYYLPNEQTSGDYFDYFAINNNTVLRVVTADVSGHGARAAFIMGIVRTLFRLSQTRYMPLDETVLLINDHLIDIIGTEDDFVTVFAADIDFSEESINYINAGHCPGMLKDNNGEIHRLDATAPLLGFFSMQPQKQKLPFNKGAELFLFTDGMYDWQQEDGALFDFSMFWKLASETMNKEKNFLEKLMNSLQEKAIFSGGFRDDLTALWIVTEK